MNSKRHLLPAVAALMLAGPGFTFLRAATIAPKGYVIAEITVTDPEAYKSYVAAVGPLVAHFGGKYVVRGGQIIAVEGDPPNGRFAVIEFDSLAAAKSFEDSPEYQAIAPLRRKSARSRVFLIEGSSQ
jgi:uncharacterized protein (DUF1330 family)